MSQSDIRSERANSRQNYWESRQDDLPNVFVQGGDDVASEMVMTHQERLIRGYHSGEWIATDNLVNAEL